MTPYPTINAEPEAVSAPDGPAAPWSRPETYVRWGLSGGYVVALAGLCSTLGGSVAPWLGWIVLLLGCGIPALGFWSRHLAHQNEIDRKARGIGTGPAFSPRFTGGTSLSAGPGRDDDHRRSPEDESEQDVSYP